MAKTELMGGIPFDDALNAGLIDPGFNEAHDDDDQEENREEGNGG